MISIMQRRESVECMDSGEEVEKKHGREEIRRYISFPINDDFPPLENDWENIQSVTKVFRKRNLKDKAEEETLFFISSHPYHSEKIKNAIRSHWHIENRLHWQLDVSFNEDGCRARIKNEAESLALMRRLSMAYLKKDTKNKRGIKFKRKKGGYDNAYLIEILGLGSILNQCEKKITK